MNMEKRLGCIIFLVGLFGIFCNQYGMQSGLQPESLVKSILDNCRLQFSDIPSDQAIELRDQIGKVGYARRFGNNIVIQFVAPEAFEKSPDMACGPCALASAIILVIIIRFSQFGIMEPLIKNAKKFYDILLGK